MKPGETAGDDAGKLGGRRAEPVEGHPVDHNDQCATGEYAQNHERKVSVVKRDIQQPAGTYVQELTGGCGW
jgi:hypothetical protein